MGNSMNGCMQAAGLAGPSEPTTLAPMNTTTPAAAPDLDARAGAVRKLRGWLRAIGISDSVADRLQHDYDIQAIRACLHLLPQLQ